MRGEGKVVGAEKLGVHNRFVLCGAAGEAVLHRPVLGKSTRGGEERGQSVRCCCCPLHGKHEGLEQGHRTAKEKRQACRMHSNNRRGQRTRWGFPRRPAALS